MQFYYHAILHAFCPTCEFGLKYFHIIQAVEKKSGFPSATKCQFLSGQAIIVIFQISADLVFSHDNYRLLGLRENVKQLFSTWCLCIFFCVVTVSPEQWLKSSFIGQSKTKLATQAYCNISNNNKKLLAVKHLSGMMDQSVCSSSFLMLSLLLMNM